MYILKFIHQATVYLCDRQAQVRHIVSLLITSHKITMLLKTNYYVNTNTA